MSKISFEAGGFQKWFAITVASSKPNGHDLGSKFNQLITSPEWDCNNIDIKILLNGVEFDNLEDLFSRVDKHIQKEAENLAEIDKITREKLLLIQRVIQGEFDGEDR